MKFNQPNRREVNMKRKTIWAIQQKKKGIGRYGDEYEEGELVEVELSRRILKMRYRPKTERIIKVCIF